MAFREVSVIQVKAVHPRDLPFHLERSWVGRPLRTQPGQEVGASNSPASLGAGLLSFSGGDVPCVGGGPCAHACGPLDPIPFIWTKTAKQIITKVRRGRVA